MSNFRKEITPESEIHGIDGEELFKQEKEEIIKSGKKYIHVEIIIPEGEEIGDSYKEQPISYIEGNGDPNLLFSVILTMHEMEKSMVKDNPILGVMLLMSEMNKDKFKADTKVAYIKREKKEKRKKDE